MKKRVIGIIAASVFAIGAVGAPVAAEPLPKTEICHLPDHVGDFPTEGDSGARLVCVSLGGIVISVNRNALPGHGFTQL